MDKVTTITVPVVSVPENKQIYFTGNFSTSIKNNTDIVISFTAERVNLLNGCNTYGAQYQAYSNGTINIGPFIGTKMACKNDLDYLYLNALGDAVFFSQSKN